jgi:hypothetical protein
MSAGRAWRWCVLRTLHDARLAARKGRPASVRQWQRRFARRWAELDETPAQQWWREMDRLGREIICGSCNGHRIDGI